MCLVSVCVCEREEKCVGGGVEYFEVGSVIFIPIKILIFGCKCVCMSVFVCDSRCVAVSLCKLICVCVCVFATVYVRE